LSDPKKTKTKASSKKSKVTKSAERHVQTSDDVELANLAQRLKLLRERHQLSQSELARRCGIDQGAISRTEAGQTGPNWETLNSIAKGLGVPMYALLVDEFDIAVFSVGIESSLREFVELQRKSLAFAESLLAEMETHRAKRLAVAAMTVVNQPVEDRYIDLSEERSPPEQVNDVERYSDPKSLKSPRPSQKG
jgi:transcriptional regulator with XRE-family HTH domain